MLLVAFAVTLTCNADGFLGVCLPSFGRDESAKGCLSEEACAPPAPLLREDERAWPAMSIAQPVGRVGDGGADSSEGRLGHRVVERITTSAARGSSSNENARPELGLAPKRLM